MAGDWLKMTHALPEKPEVLEIAGRTSLSRFDVVGRLFILWRWFDTNTVDGNARGVTKVTLNACLFGDGDVTNFVSAVVDARWLAVSDDGISVVKFDSHISESAKTRGQTAKRVAKSKANAGNAEGNAKTVTKTVPREEKRREEKSSSSLRSEDIGGSKYPVEFEVVWSAYPDRPGASKAGALKAWSARIKAGASADEILAGVERYAAYCKASGTEPTFIKQPATFFGPDEHYLSDWTPVQRTATNAHKYAAAARTIFGDDADERRTINA